MKMLRSLKKKASKAAFADEISQVQSPAPEQDGSGQQQQKPHRRFSFYIGAKSSHSPRLAPAEGSVIVVEPTANEESSHEWSSFLVPVTFTRRHDTVAANADAMSTNPSLLDHSHSHSTPPLTPDLTDPISLPESDNDADASSVPTPSHYPDLGFGEHAGVYPKCVLGPLEVPIAKTLKSLDGLGLQFSQTPLQSPGEGAAAESYLSIAPSTDTGFDFGLPADAASKASLATEQSNYSLTSASLGLLRADFPSPPDRAAMALRSYAAVGAGWHAHQRAPAMQDEELLHQRYRQAFNEQAGLLRAFDLTRGIPENSTIASRRKASTQSSEDTDEDDQPPAPPVRTVRALVQGKPVRTPTTAAEVDSHRATARISKSMEAWRSNSHLKQYYSQSRSSSCCERTTASGSTRYVTPPLSSVALHQITGTVVPVCAHPPEMACLVSDRCRSASASAFRSVRTAVQPAAAEAEGKVSALKRLRTIRRTKSTPALKPAITAAAQSTGTHASVPTTPAVPVPAPFLRPLLASMHSPAPPMPLPPPHQQQLQPDADIESLRSSDRDSAASLSWGDVLIQASRDLHQGSSLKCQEWAHRVSCYEPISLSQRAGVNFSRPL